MDIEAFSLYPLGCYVITKTYLLYPIVKHMWKGCSVCVAGLLLAVEIQ